MYTGWDSGAELEILAGPFPDGSTMSTRDSSAPEPGAPVRDSLAQRVRRLYEVSDASGRLTPMEGLRGFAVLMVFLFIFIRFLESSRIPLRSCGTPPTSSVVSATLAGRTRHRIISINSH